MQTQQLFDFWSQENPCCIQLEEAICLAASVLLRDGMTYSAELSRRVEYHGYYHISGRILNQTLNFLVENKICRKERADEHYRERLNAVNPKWIYVLDRTTENLETLERLKEIWQTRISPRGATHRLRQVGMPTTISA